MDGIPIVSDGGDTIHTLNQIRKLSIKEMETIKNIVNSFGCEFENDAIVIKLEGPELPVQCLRLGNVLLLIYGKFINRLLKNNQSVILDNEAWNKVLIDAEYG